MTILTAVGEILPVTGTIGLLGLWLYQQKQVEKHTNELRNISSARTIYQTYQSNNAIFNAIAELTDTAKTASAHIRSFQIYNYELGLSAMESLLSEPEKKGLPPGINNLADIRSDPEKAIETTQQRLSTLYARLDEKEQLIKSASGRSKKYYLRAYLCFSLISIIGAICKILAK